LRFSMARRSEELPRVVIDNSYFHSLFVDFDCCPELFLADPIAA